MSSLKESRNPIAGFGIWFDSSDQVLPSSRVRKAPNPVPSHSSWSSASSLTFDSPTLPRGVRRRQTGAALGGFAAAGFADLAASSLAEGARCELEPSAVTSPPAGARVPPHATNIPSPKANRPDLQLIRRRYVNHPRPGIAWLEPEVFTAVETLRYSCQAG